MKKVLFILLLVIVSLGVEAQVNFMGIPVEGSVSNMMYQLKKKGFKDASQDYGENRMTGRFYNRDVVLSISTNKYDEVEAVSVLFMASVWRFEGYDRTSVIKLYNDLYESFNNNENYLWVSWLIRDFEKFHCVDIKNDENLWYNITDKGMEYHVDYSQLPTDNHNCVHFMISKDEQHYNKFFILLMYENLSIKTYGDDDL